MYYMGLLLWGLPSLSVVSASPVVTSSTVALSSSLSRLLFTARRSTSPHSHNLRLHSANCSSSSLILSSSSFSSTTTDVSSTPCAQVHIYSGSGVRLGSGVSLSYSTKVHIYYFISVHTIVLTALIGVLSNANGSTMRWSIRI